MVFPPLLASPMSLLAELVLISTTSYRSRARVRPIRFHQARLRDRHRKPSCLLLLRTRCASKAYRDVRHSSFLASPHHHIKSKSSTPCLYRKMFLRTLLPSTHVTKSSMSLVTRNAASVTTSVPTLTCPCSTNRTAAVTFSAMRSRVITTPRRRRARLETPTLRSTSLSLKEELEVERRARLESFSKRRDSCFRRVGSLGGRLVRAWASWRREPQIPGVG